jgi:hypothetical protein
MIDDFRDGGKRYLDDLAVGYFHLQARGRQCLCGLHAADDAAHAIAVRGNDLYVVLAVERLECCEGFGDFHFIVTALSSVSSDLHFEPDAQTLWSLKRPLVDDPTLEVIALNLRGPRVQRMYSLARRMLFSITPGVKHRSCQMYRSFARLRYNNLKSGHASRQTGSFGRDENFDNRIYECNRTAPIDV